jgi:site-specific DNA recombinase
MMRAAIYARRSTEEHQAASLDVQVDEARRFIAAKGSTVADENVYLEDGVSRAEFKKRPALDRLREAVRTEAFEVVVIRDETRLGGDVIRTTMVMLEIVEAGVEIVCYANGESVRLDDPTKKLIAVVKNYGAEEERLKISSRVREHLQSKARKGFNTGGRVYGYDNVRIEGRGVDFEVNEGEARVVRDMAHRFIEGEGWRGIARALNDEGIPSPRAGKRGTGSWAPSSVRSILTNPRYTGRIEWGEFRKGYKGGTRVRERQSKASLVVVERPELRILDEATWEAIQARLRHTGPSRPTKQGRKFRHLLTGWARCSECGGRMQVESGRFGSELAKLYSCKQARERGPTVCKNRMRRPVEEVHATLLDWIQKNVLTESVMIETLKVLRRRLEARGKTVDSDLKRLEKQAGKLRTEIQNLVNTARRLSDPTPVLEAIEESTRQLKAIDARIEAAKATPKAIDIEVRRMEQEARKRLRDLKSMLALDGDEPRKAMEALLAGPVVLKPVKEGRRAHYEISGAITTGAFCVNVASPQGFEPWLLA